jgi:hypothetical protein
MTRTHKASLTLPYRVRRISRLHLGPGRPTAQPTGLRRRAGALAFGRADVPANTGGRKPEPVTIKPCAFT